MKFLWSLNDRGGWGSALIACAAARGWKTQIGNLPRDNGYCFMRINQGGHRMEAEKRLATVLVEMGQVVIPEPWVISTYEDKLRQTLLFRNWMPPTHILLDRGSAEAVLPWLTYPFLSKSRTGSASRNVRLIETEAQAREEIRWAFTNGFAPGHKLGESLQKDYLIWQDFIPGNRYDYRVCRIGQYYMVLRRFNRAGSPFASGSGKNEPVVEIRGAELITMFEKAVAFFDQMRTCWCGIDLIQSSDGEWFVLEATLGWSQAAYQNCVFFDRSGNPTDRRGHEIWQVLLDAIEEGVWQ